MAGFVINVHRGEDGWFADCDKLSIYAIGRTAPKALRDFGQQLEYLKKYYRQISHDGLTGLATKLKNRFERLE